MKTCGTSEAACIVMLEVYVFALSFICIWLLSVHTWFYIFSLFDCLPGTVRTAGTAKQNRVCTKSDPN